MICEGVAPDAVTYGAIISGLCKEGFLEKAFKIFQEMVALGYMPSVLTYSVLISAHCKVGAVSKAFEMFQQMVVTGVEPDIVTYTSLIHGDSSLGHWILTGDVELRSYTKHRDIQHFNEFSLQKGKAGEAHKLWIQ